jgi:hypothetical protein
MIERSRRAVGAVLVLSLVVQAGCGTVLYPDRRGQKGGRVDPGVAVLDGLGLLFFILPGVIAFAVDFGNGAIYLPPKGNAPASAGDFKMIPFDARRADEKEIERIVRENTGIAVSLDQAGMRRFELNSLDDIPVCFAAAGFLTSR